MNRLQRRVERLEVGHDPEVVLIWGHWPLGCTEARFLELATTRAREMGYKPPFRISASCSNLPRDESDITLIYIGTGAELDALLKSISQQRRLITERN